MGITQHTTGTDNVKSLANLAMLCGNLGIEGGGVNPLRGQNNVQGACDLGGLPDVYTGYQKVIDPAARNKMEEAWGVENLPDQPGLKVTEMLPKAHEGELKALYIVGENPLVSDPDLNHAEASLKNLDLLVVQDIFLTETARIADVVLPSTCFAEKDGTFSNTERRVQRIRKALDPPGEARGDWQIICDLAGRMGYDMSYADASEIMTEIAGLTPSYAGISYERIEKEGLHWPCPTPEHPGTPILHVDMFASGKGVFYGIDWIAPAENTDEEYPLYLTTGRVLYQYHTGTMTMKSEGLMDRAPECFVEIASRDAESYGLEDGDMVSIASRRGSIEARINVSEKAVNGTVFIPFHYAKAAANRLTNAALDPIAKIPEFKVCAVKLAKVA
jgi:predicted molibdopterin-dependent oxidoreductase YjgC